MVSRIHTELPLVMTHYSYWHGIWPTIENVDCTCRWCSSGGGCRCHTHTHTHTHTHYKI